MTYGISQGTSMASPHVAGVVALMKAVASTMTPDDFDTALRSGAITEDLGTAGRDDNFGHGLINALDAVLYAQEVIANGGTPPANPFLAISPGSLNFNTAGINATLSVNNAGTGALTVGTITNDSGGWLTVTPTSVDTDGLGSYAVSVNRNGLDDNTYTATITVPSTNNNVTIPVIMQVTTVATFNDVGIQYILIFDPVTEVVVDLVVAQPFNGSYSFAFPLIAPGNYQIFAGTDLDDDGFICDSGEACGFYPDSGSPDQNTFAVTDTDVLDIGFISSFTNGLNGSALGAQSVQKPRIKIPVNKKISGVAP